MGDLEGISIVVGTATQQWKKSNATRSGQKHEIIVASLRGGNKAKIYQELRQEHLSYSLVGIKEVVLSATQHRMKH